jgi:hypothetical protein
MQVQFGLERNEQVDAEQQPAMQVRGESSHRG